MYAFTLLFFSIAQTLLKAHSTNKVFLSGLRARSALISTIYKKSLRLSNAARKKYTLGEIVNLMAVDTQRFADEEYLNTVWSSPLQIALSMYFVWGILGPSTLAGIAVFLLLLPVNKFIMTKKQIYQTTQMQNKDKRMRLINETLSNIQTVKLYSMEPVFEKLISKARDEEVQAMKKAVYIMAIDIFLWMGAPVFVRAPFALFKCVTITILFSRLA